jgi:serine/threonine-protein kinase
MSESVSREEFQRNLSDSGLLEVEDLRSALDVLDSLPGNPDGETLARYLARTGRLTAFQAEAVLRRRFADLRVGNYDVLSQVGAGGMGAVFRARHRRMKRVVALKILGRQADREGTFARRFQREVETIARLGHPNIVMAFDAGEAEVGLYLVMEFVEGRDLGTEVASRGPLPAADAVDRILQAARGLAYAHGQGFIHRDVKPANLLRDSSGLVKVADLGLARLEAQDSDEAGGSLTQAGGILGTAEFMAPEQAIDSTSVDHRADIYALGCTLFFLLTGKAPYQANSVMALLLAHRDKPIPSLCEVRPGLPAALGEVFRKMVAKKPEERYQTMAEVVRALEELRPAASAPEAGPAAPGPLPTNALPFQPTVALDSAEQLRSSDFSVGTPESSIVAAPTCADVPRIADMTVVLAEPSRAQASIVRKYLRELGIERIHATGSGREALVLAKEPGVHVLLSAMHLADMTGLQLAQALHAEPDCQGVGFVLASSESDGGAGQPLESPRSVLLPKPFDLRQLAESLAKATVRTPDELNQPRPHATKASK